MSAPVAFSALHFQSIARPHHRNGLWFLRFLAVVILHGTLSCSEPAFGDEATVITKEATVTAKVDFKTQVAPILEKRCAGCHGADQQEASLRLDQFSGLVAGGKSGPVIIPGKPDESTLIAAVRYQDESLRMPPDEKLPPEEIELLNRWVHEGAAHPEGEILPVDPVPVFDVAASREFWSFRPIESPAVPSVKDWTLVFNPIDSFVVKQLEASGFEPNGVADRATLIRRATLDLTGFPPTPEDVDSFVNDPDPDAFARVVDRLLNSPSYGERWARHWLDVVRYADSNGLDENIAHGNAWRYRDYVIESFNSDLPYNQFVKEQIAGDLLAATESDPVRQRQMLVATGFLAMGPKVLAEADQTKMLMDIIDEQIDTTGRAFLGMTFGCARCHNHKFDPVAQSDYYSLVGIYKSTYTMESLKTIARWHENSVATPEDLARIDDHKNRIELKKKEVADYLANAMASLGASPVSEDQLPEEAKKRLAELREEQKTLESSLPSEPTAMGVKEGTPERARINIRGSHLTLGRPVPRGVPVVLQVTGPLEIPEQESGRRQFADWLANPQNPLTARVIVNRLWRWHFGRGLVASTDNFGLLGEKPTHPELLDWLSAEFIRSGWSLKAMHRLMLLSRTWQLSNSDENSAAATDPANVSLWKFSMRRLEAEALRDSVLQVSGLLDETRGGSMLHVGNREFLFNHTSKDETRYDSLRRSIYLPVIRNNLYDGFSLFDCTDCAVSNSDRATSTVASQALYALNSPLMLQAGKSLADRLFRETPESEADRIQRLYRLAFSREPSADERVAVFQALQKLRTDFISEGVSEPEAQSRSWAIICHTVLASNEFVYLR